MTTGWPSAVARTSISTPSAPRAIASLNAARVFSGARPEAPLCAMTSGLRTGLGLILLAGGGSYGLDLLARGAEAKDAMAVMQRLESVLAGDLVLHLLDLFAVE